MSGTISSQPSQGAGRITAMPRWERAAYWFMIIFSAVVSFFEIHVFRNFMVDDAFITLRYVRNALAGNGLVYNTGDRVEGFTSPLHVLLTFILGLFNPDLVLSSKLLGVFSFLFILGVLCLWRSRRSSHDLIGLPEFAVTFSIVATSFSLTFFSVTGMETILFSLLTLLVFLDATRFQIRFRSIFTIFAAFLCRPEGIIFGPWLLLATFIKRRSENDPVTQKSGFLSCFKPAEVLNICVFMSFVFAFEFLRWMYYGEFFPNTFYAKAPWTMESGTAHWSMKGMGSIAYFFSVSGGALGILLFGAALFRRGNARGILLLVAALTLAQLCFQKYAGSDWMVGSRYFITVLPVWAVGIGISLFVLNVLTPLLPPVRCAVVCLSVFAIALTNLSDTSQFIRNIDKYPNNVQTSVGLTEIGAWIDRNVPRDFRIRNWRIGAIGYYCDNPVIDTWGLVDREIGRLRFHASSESEGNTLVKAHIAGMKPEIVITKVDVGQESGEKGYKLVHEGRNGSELIGVLVRSDLAHLVKQRNIP